MMVSRGFNWFWRLPTYVYGYLEVRGVARKSHPPVHHFIHTISTLLWISELERWEMASWSVFFAMTQWFKRGLLTYLTFVAWISDHHVVRSDLISNCEVTDQRHNQTTQSLIIIREYDGKGEKHDIMIYRTSICFESDIRVMPAGPSLCRPSQCWMVVYIIAHSFRSPISILSIWLS